MIFKNPRDLKDTKGFEICLDKDMSISLICSRISRKTLIVAHDCRLQTHLPHTQAHQLQSQMVMRTGPMSNDVFQCNCTNLTCPDSLRVHLHNNTHKPAMRPSGAGTLPHRESHRATPPIRVRSPRRPSIWRAQLGMFLEKIKTREHHDRTGPPPNTTSPGHDDDRIFPTCLAAHSSRRGLKTDRVDEVRPGARMVPKNDHEAHGFGRMS